MRRVQHMLIALILCAPACSKEEAPPASGHELYQLCVSCHAEDGRGNRVVNAPAIAGMDAWYVEAQLHKFKTGVRGTHPSDSAGMQMRPMAMSLRGDQEIKNVAGFVEKLAKTAPVPVLTGGKAETGQALFAPCTACHGVKAEGSQEKHAPPLTRTNDWYLLRQIQKFKGKVRGARPEDAEGAQMMPWVATLTNEQAMRDVVAYIQTLR